MPTFRQQSTVTVADNDLTIVSEILLEPEALIVTSVLLGETLVRKRHAPLSSAVLDDYQTRGDKALTACLQGTHLRFVRRLLSVEAPVLKPRRTPMPAGIVATLVLGAEGEVMSSAGEDEIPSSWLRGVYLLASLCDSAERSFGAGKLIEATAQGASLRAVLRRSAAQTAVCFTTPANDDQPDGTLSTLLEELACGIASK